jgi:phenylpropionate dioxygenase-like ring-hydroxylating dioxygenase large terminal subunit
MVSAVENRLLTDVAPGAPMHRLWKSYWLPCIRPQKLVAGGRPERIRLLGENYVAFRAHDGRIGFFDEQCPHRRASLTLARNEDCALRCIFHGWKFDVSGEVVETPNDRRPGFREQVRLRHFPTREAGGMVWVYLGEGVPPRFPDVVFNTLPESQVWARAAVVPCNFLQGLEGTLDPSHVAILHQNITRAAQSLATLSLMPEAEPRFETEGRPYGLSVAALRDLAGGERYVRVTEYIAPGISLIPYGADEPQQCIMTIPIDSFHTLQWNVFFHYKRPLTEAEREIMLLGTGRDDDDIYQPPDKPYWGQDREAMAADSFSGLAGVIIEDFVIAESMGVVVDRENEQLCAADLSVVRLRRFLKAGLDSIAGGGKAPGLEGDVDFAAIRSTAGVFAAGEDWRGIASAPREPAAAK